MQVPTAFSGDKLPASNNLHWVVCSEPFL